MRARAAWTIAPETPLQFLRGVGEARAALLAAAGLDTVGDLLYSFPYRYEDRRHTVRISEIAGVMAPVTLRGTIISATLRTSPIRKLKIFEAIVDDGSGRVMLVWFNQAWLAEQLRRNDRLVIHGQPRVNSRGRLQIENPAFEKLGPDGEADEEGAIIPIYSSVSGIAPKTMRRIAQQALEAAARIEDPLPEEIRSRLDVIGLREAIINLHRPAEIDEAFLQGRSAAHRRMIIQEFFSFQLALRLRRATQETDKRPRAIEITDAIRDRIRSILPFRLTAAQKRVLREIATDMQSDRPMYRLLQGDVGSGKTIVALVSALLAIENGFQVALLAPTEILSEQHHQRIVQLLSAGGRGVRVAKLTANANGRERDALLRGLREGTIDLVIGTHALLEERVVFSRLGLAIVDEQHRFGVEHRQCLFAKGRLPDVLVMTATPIPRSMALAMYGDLELSVIDELPPGRKPVTTVIRGTARLPNVLGFLEEQVKAGAQGYVVFPLIEDSDKLDLTSLTAGFETIRQGLPSCRLAMLHGRMPPDEKEQAMRRFVAQEVDVLVSTTVIEVGVDVSNASMMIVIDADRFGLAQLHQLRGRIGRGQRKSYCALIRSEGAGEEAKERLRAFRQTSDGFEVAQRDLELRGAGDFLGTRQSGVPRFRFGDLVGDYPFMELAREAAIELVDQSRTRAGELLGRLAAGERASRLPRD
ncbi:MAG TPA: ATP-dependent DNA helicase RecG [Thermoanaerobaculia bacterium]|nr:ATP-dependent DNA helicase RecG [Thermoanaerobaculia bacterium]